MNHPSTPTFPTLTISIQIGPSWNAPLALPAFGYDHPLGLKPQAVMGCAVGATEMGDGVWPHPARWLPTADL